MGMPPEVVQQLLDAGLKLFSISPSVCLLTDPVLQTLLCHCHMAHADGGISCNVFWKVCIRESEIDGDGSQGLRHRGTGDVSPPIF